MTKSTSPRSVRDIPKTDAKQGTNGTPPTDPDSVVISVPSPESARESTGWTIQFSSGGVHHIRVKGGRGRISYSSPRGGIGGEVRVYRNESTKTFDALFTNVTHVVSDRVEVIPAKWGSGIDIDPKLNGSPPKKTVGTPPKEKEEAPDLSWTFTPSATTAGSIFKASKGSTKKRPPLNPEEF